MFLRLLSASACLLISAHATAALALEAHTMPTNDTALVSRGVTERTYLLEDARIDCVGRSPILMIVLHGGGQSAQSTADYTQFHKKARCAVVVYPNGVNIDANTFQVTADGGGWYHQMGGPVLKADIVRADDVGFLRQLISSLLLDYGLTAAHATGISNGGAMAYRLACEGLVVAAEPVAANMESAQCQWKNEVTIFHQHGLKDTCIPWDGGPTSCYEYNPPVSSALDAWRKNNGLIDKTQITERGRGVSCTEYQGSGASVEWCLYNNGAHDWPWGSIWRIWNFVDGLGQ